MITRTNLAIFGIILPLVSVAIYGCGQQPAIPSQREPLPSERQADYLRHTEAPATAEVRDLRAQELSAQLAAVRASADGKAAEAERQRQIGAELGKLRTFAEQRARDQRSELDRLASEAEKRAVEDRTELDRRTANAAREAAELAEQQHADAMRTWAIVAAGGACALAVGLGFLMTVVLGLPRRYGLGIPAAIGVSACVLAGWFAAGAWLLWILAGLVMLAVIGGALWIVMSLFGKTEHLSAVASDAVAHGDALKDTVRASASMLGQEVRAAIDSTIDSVKSSSLVIQTKNGTADAIKRIKEAL